MIDDLVAAAGGDGARLTGRELARLVDRLARHPDRWRRLLATRRPTDDRWYELLHRSAAVEVWLLGWGRGHATDLHDHGGASGAFVVTEGELIELHGSLERWRGGRRRTWGPGRAVGFGPGYVHDLHRVADGPAISLHAYSPPLRTMTFYRPAGARLVPLGRVWSAGPEPAAAATTEPRPAPPPGHPVPDPVAS